MPDPIPPLPPSEVKDRVATVLRFAQAAFNPPSGPLTHDVILFIAPTPYVDGESRVMYGASADLETVIEVLAGFLDHARKAALMDRQGTVGNA